MDIRVPEGAESITEATVGKWLKAEGDGVALDEIVVEVETDKATIEVRSPVEGLLEKVLVPTGATVKVGALLGRVKEGAGAAAVGRSPNAGLPVSAPVPEDKCQADRSAPRGPASPAARKIAADCGLSLSTIRGSGKDGRILKEDVLLASEDRASSSPTERAAGATGSLPSAAPLAARPPVTSDSGSRSEGDGRRRRARMTQLRRTIAARLKQAQNTAAILTTFNEVDMSATMAARARYKDIFERKHGVRMGFMAFFVKACVAALHEIPAINAQIEGDDIVYNDAVHMGVAVGTDRGLVVPVLRDADQMSFAQIEKGIARLGRLARDGKLSLGDMQGGTFTISNGGVYGSMLSTPILNPPQSGILGMHRIQDRATVVDGKIEIRPVMYLALSYDHRIVDGKEAVLFLVTVKAMLEDPSRLVLGV